MSVSSLALFEYLEQLPGTTFKRLYKQPSTALAIFRRMLPHLGMRRWRRNQGYMLISLAKTFVMALLYMSKPFPLTDLDSWTQPKSQRQKDQALALLTRLHVVTITAPSRDVVQTVTLTPTFRTSLRLALSGGGNHQSFGVPSSHADDSVDLAFLDEYARAQWEGILHFVVSSVGRGTAQEGTGPTTSVKQLLHAGGLVENGRGSSGITQAGFSFLLQEVNAQVWALLRLWIEHAEQMELDPVEILSFLFMLGSLDLGRVYSIANLSTAQKQMLHYLTDFGLIYLPSPKASHFFPTRLSTTLTSDASALRSVSAGFDAALASTSTLQGFIIIETNYRLYAYTSSPLQIAVLSLFTKLHLRWSNMVSGRITRNSIRAAISHGITSEQIIAYLTSNAHPQLHKHPSVLAGGPVLPPTVVDQIRLWQIENERMVTNSGFLFTGFDTLRDYEACVKYAEEIGVLVWRGDAKRAFFVTRHEQLSAFWKARKNGAK